MAIARLVDHMLSHVTGMAASLVEVAALSVEVAAELLCLFRQ